ncbi:MAG: S8 family serine peptidase [Pseudorhodoplanes sp.]
MPRKANVCLPLVFGALIALGLSSGPDGARAATFGPNINVAPRMPSMTVTPRMSPNFHYDRVRVPPGWQDGDKGGRPDRPDRPEKKWHKPRKIIIIEDGGPSGKDPSGPSGGAKRAPKRNNVPAANEQRYRPDEVLITVSQTFTEANANALSRRFRLTRVESQNFALTSTRMFRWRIPDGRSVPAVIRALESRGFTAQPNYVFALQQDGNKAAEADKAGVDNASQDQYVVAKLRLTAAHALAQGNVLIAVIDSGIDAAHPELTGVVAETFDAAGAPSPHAHGTGIAGAISARARLMGAAPAARLLAVQAFGPKAGSAEGTSFTILKSLDWAVGKGARVVNMSFAGPRDPGLEKAFAAARQKGVVLVAAAGNAGPKSPPLYPAADANVIAVSATDANDKLFAASNRGSYVAVAAPGVDVLLPAPEAAYQVTSGTSFAAAYVSGVVALMLERNPQLSPDDVRRVLMTSARDLGPKGRDDMFGAGLIDALQAVTAAEPKTSTASGQ